MDKPRIILASTSPRRRELLARLSVPFELASPDVPETPIVGESPSAMVQRLCRAKALASSYDFSGAVVIAADTVVVLEGQILVKPEDAADAVRMLVAMRNRAHQVLSGVTVVSPEAEDSTIVETVVWMRDYTDEEIERYVRSGDPFDKAGAYAIQNADFHPVARLEGCPTSVMGFPLCQVDRILRWLGLIRYATPVQTCQPPSFCALAFKKMANC